MKKTTIETFKRLSDYTLKDLTQKEPYVFNDDAYVIRYRITVEEIEESRDAICQRLLKLWRTTTNHHHWAVLKREAARLGFELPHEQIGKDRK